jgi:hypothetical protein
VSKENTTLEAPLKKERPPRSASPMHICIDANARYQKATAGAQKHPDRLTK